MKKRFLSIITALALCLTMFPVGVMAAGTTHTVTSQEEFNAALQNASPGDTISISGSVTLYENSQDALVIDKNVTITGGSLIVRYSGIVLGADVTFRNITLLFPSRSRNAIMANGYTLALENVLRDTGGQQIHLFCGGMTGREQANLPTQGNHGRIIILGSTSLGNIYAGSISSDGKANVFDKPATITIDDTATGSMGSIYASGALETPAGDNWFDVTSEVAPPTASITVPQDYRVTGAVTIQLYGNRVLRVDGATGGSRNAAVEFRGDRSRTDNVVLTNIAQLSMESGYLVPGVGSSFSGTDTSVLVQKETTLGLNNFGAAPVIGNFSGGGDLLLAEKQTLTITGTVSGVTRVGIGDIHPSTNESSGIVTAGHTYIQAANSAEGDFTLAPPNNNPSLELAYDAVYGTWTTASTGSDLVLVERFVLASAAVASGQTDVYLPLNPTFAANSATPLAMDFIPLEITVNGVTATCKHNPDPDYDDYYIYTVDGLSLEVILDELYITPAVGSALSSGTYAIIVTVPEDYSASGEALTCSATLKVAEAGSDYIEIPIPEAITGLRYTGSVQIGVPEGVGYYIEDNMETEAGYYTATATLMDASDSQWSGGAADPQIIPWNIEKAAGPAAPTGLGAAAPSASGLSNGKITGTTTRMEYADNPSFSGAATCGAGETTGLTAGTYYVRVKVSDTTNYEMGEAATVDIPDALTISSIAVNSTAHRTAYTVGDTLDVAGLTIAVTMSDGSTRTVVVTADMVSGFSSDRAGHLTLTVTYEGKTTSYTAVVVSADENLGYTVRFEPNGGTGTAYTVSDISGRYILPAYTACGFTAPADMQFKAWASGSTSGEQFAPGSSYTISADTTFYAIWDGSASEIMKIEQNELTKAPEGLKDSSFNTVQSIKNELTRVLTTNPAYMAVHTAVYDIKLQISTDGGQTWSEATETNFPWDGITVTIPYPSGTGKTTHDFAVTHMFTVTSTQLRTVAGQTEQPAVTKLDEGLKVTLKGLSPVGIAWKSISSGGSSGGGGASTYAVTVEDTAHGTVKADRTRAVSGATVAITVAPDEGYALNALTVTDSRGNELKLTDKGGGRYDFTMPASKVIVEAVFVPIKTESEPCNGGIDCPSRRFADLSTAAWYHEAVDYALTKGLMGGYDSGLFGPEDLLSRSMLVQILYNAEGRPAIRGGSAFADVKTDAWYADAVAWANANGIVSGYPDNVFGPNDPITREQLAAILWHYAQFKGYDITQGGMAIREFSDYESIDTYAVDAMTWAVNTSVVGGYEDKTLRPQDSATRAEAAQMLMNFSKGNDK